MKRLLLMGIPRHGNLGDNAIAVAEEELLNKYFNEFEKIYVSENDLFEYANNNADNISSDDILILHGGGNIGDTYEVPEKGRRAIITKYHNNKIIIMPQTLYFSDTEKGRNELEISKEIYNSHPNLVILARENKSYNFAKKHFYNAKVYLTPDIVMTLEKKEKLERKGALLLFRNDKEKTLENSSIEKIKELSFQQYGNYIESDMSIGDAKTDNVEGKYREELLDDKFRQFQKAEVAITDRLHGMIFAAITETPCIVFSNFNHKIIESYEWLKNLGYIKLCSDLKDVEKYIKELKENANCTYSSKFANDIIIPILKKEIENN